jgi:hypothetical protein
MVKHMPRTNPRQNFYQIIFVEYQFMDEDYFIINVKNPRDMLDYKFTDLCFWFSHYPRNKNDPPMDEFYEKFTNELNWYSNSDKIRNFKLNIYNTERRKIFEEEKSWIYEYNTAFEMVYFPQGQIDLESSIVDKITIRDPNPMIIYFGYPYQNLVSNLEINLEIIRPIKNEIGCYDYDALARDEGLRKQSRNTFLDENIKCFRYGTGKINDLGKFSKYVKFVS